MKKLEYKNKRLQYDNGYSLLELVVYISVLSIFSVVVVFSLLNMTRAFSKIRIERNINNAAFASMDRMIRELRLSEGVDILNSTFGVNPGKLTLNTTLAGGGTTTVQFFTASSSLQVKEGGVLSGNLVPSNIKVENLVFNLITNGPVQAVKIDMSLSDTRASSSIKNFYTTGLIRGSY